MDGFEMVRRYRSLESAECVARANRGGGGHTPSVDATRAPANQMPPTCVSTRRARPPLAIVGISANSDLVAHSLASSAGMNAFVSKPFALADLSDAVATTLGRPL